MVRTYLYDLPLKCRGFILKDPYTGDEAIILNARLTNEANRETYAHEIYHKCHGDLDSGKDVNAIESEAHRLKT